VALGVIRFGVPREDPPWHLWDQVYWALFVTLIPPWVGALCGAGVGAFLYWRAPRVRLLRLTIETSLLGATIAFAVSQRMLPITWGIPPLPAARFAVLVGGVLAALGVVLLKPLYWRKRVPSRSRKI
jgi:hypothetical protein